MVLPALKKTKRFYYFFDVYNHQTEREKNTFVMKIRNSKMFKNKNNNILRV